MCERDKDCEFIDLCIEMYGEDKNFSCNGTDNCEHYNMYLEGKCTVLES